MSICTTNATAFNFNKNVIIAKFWDWIFLKASATHRQMTDKQLEECGVGADLIRLSCGLENALDLIADLEQAIDKV